MGILKHSRPDTSGGGRWFAHPHGKVSLAILSFMGLAAVLGTTLLELPQQAARKAIEAVGIGDLVYTKSMIEDVADNVSSYHDLWNNWTCIADFDSFEMTPGGTVELPVQWQGRLDLLEKHRDKWEGVYLVTWAERVYTKDGQFSTAFNGMYSTHLTPAGLAIETFQHNPPLGKLNSVFSSPAEGILYFSQDELPLKDGRFDFDGVIPVDVDPEIPEGYYRLHMDMMVKVRGENALLRTCRLPLAWGTDLVTQPLNPLLLARFGRLIEMIVPETGYRHMVRVGQPETPRLLTVPFSRRTFHGVRGIVAVEDREHFALSNRSNYGRENIIHDSFMRGDLCLAGFAPGRIQTELGGGNDQLPEVYRWAPILTDGRLDVVLERPDGKVSEWKDVVIKGHQKSRMETEPSLEFDVRETGSYILRLKGWATDTQGIRYEIRGTYPFLRALPMSFSTAAKLGSSFYVGRSFPPKVQVNPRIPAYTRVEVEFYPQSDKARKKSIVHEGYANEFGYFIPKVGSPKLIFDEPGEYFVNILTVGEGPRGMIFAGSQNAAGVVAEENPAIQLHGLMANPHYQNMDGENFGFLARYNLHDEMPYFARSLDVSNSPDINPAYYSGDTVFLPSTMDGTNSHASYLSQRTDTDLLDELVNRLSGVPHLATANPPDIPSFDQYLKGYFEFNPIADAAFIIRKGSPQLPTISLHRKGWDSGNFPEGNNILNYNYFCSIRPGFPAFALVQEATAHSAYWTTSPNSFSMQFNAADIGDLPEDLYRVDGGLVYRNLDTGESSYAAYASTIVMERPETYKLRVAAPTEYPLVTVHGRDYDLFLAIEAGAVLHPGEPLVLAAVIFPAVPAYTHMEMRGPSGQVWAVEGKGSDIGIFVTKDSVIEMPEPGIYEVRATCEYNGKHGGVYGVYDAEYYHYVVDPDRERFLTVDLPPMMEFDPTKNLPLKVRTGMKLKNAKLSWLVMCPGILMDRGTVPLEDETYTYPFLGAHFATQFINYQVLDYQTGKPYLAKGTVIVFYVEGEDENGVWRHDAVTLGIRANKVYNLGNGYPESPLAKQILNQHVLSRGRALELAAK